jgi:hypothetical protein
MGDLTEPILLADAVTEVLSEYIDAAPAIYGGPGTNRGTTNTKAIRSQLGSRVGLDNAKVAIRASRLLNDRRNAKGWLPGRLAQAVELLADGVPVDEVACRVVDDARAVLNREVPE